MEFLAVAIVLATVLFLVDRNKKWGLFWKTCAALALIAAIGVGYLMYSGAQRRHAMTPDSFMATQR